MRCLGDVPAGSSRHRAEGILRPHSGCISADQPAVGGAGGAAACGCGSACAQPAASWCMLEPLRRHRASCTQSMHLLRNHSMLLGLLLMKWQMCDWFQALVVSFWSRSDEFWTMLCIHHQASSPGCSSVSVHIAVPIASNCMACALTLTQWGGDEHPMTAVRCFAGPGRAICYRMQCRVESEASNSAELLVNEGSLNSP